MTQSALAPLRDSTAPTSSPPSAASVPVAIKSSGPLHSHGAQRPRDRSGSDLSASVVSTDSSIFDTVSMSDTASVASSVPSDSEDNLHDIDFKFHPPRISSKTFVQQLTTETIEEDPDEDSENGDQVDQVVGNAIHPAVQVTGPSPRPATPSSPLPLRLDTDNIDQNADTKGDSPTKDDSPIEMRHPKQKATQKLDVVNGKNHSAASKSPQSAAIAPGTPKPADAPPSPDAGGPAKKAKSGFFHLPKLNRSKSQTAMHGEAKLHNLKDSIIHVFSASANNSVVRVNKTPPESKSPSNPGTPDLSSNAPSTKSSVEPTPHTSPHPSPVQQFSISPTPQPLLGPGPRRVASVGPNMMLAKANILKHDDTQVPVTGAGHKVEVQTRPNRAISDPPAAVGVRRTKTLRECGVTNRGKVAGKGATSTVTRASCHGKVVALKTFQKDKSGESDAEFKRRIDVEYEIAHSLHHPNVVETMDLVWDDGKHNWAETMEWCGGGDLFSIIKNGSMTAVERNCCFKQLIRGVAYMHSMGVAHRDIKPENLLLNEEGQLKISDFGVSDICVHEGEGPKKCRGLCGSLPYMAPEIHTQDEYDGFALDIWGCGIVYITLAFGGMIWHKAAPGDPGWDLFMGYFHRAEERTQKKKEEQKHIQQLEAQKEAEDARSTASSVDHENDKKSFKSEDNDGLSRASSSLSFKAPSPTNTPPNGYSVPNSPTPSTGRPTSSDGKAPKRVHSFRLPPPIKPDNMVQSPLPLSKTAGAAKVEVKAVSPHFPPFECFVPNQRRLIYRLLDPNPATRITAPEILKDPWFKEIQCCSFDPDELFRVQSGTFDASKGTVNKKRAMPVKHKHPNHLIKPVKK